MNVIFTSSLVYLAHKVAIIGILKNNLLCDSKVRFCTVAIFIKLLL